MEDKQIIELYWNRSEDAIQKTEEKYGADCSYIAQHILQDEAEVQRCVKECYEMLWESIPPRRPQNLKAYLCKITRNQALHMKYPEWNEQNTDLFTTELVIQEFLKGLEVEQRKLFVAYYWYFCSVSEIALMYKMNENKVNTTLASLRQKLDDELQKKNVRLHTEADLLYAMTEIDDHFWEEVIVIQEQSQSTTADAVKTSALKWNMGVVGVVVAVVILAVVALLWPKNTLEQNPTESELASGTEESESTIIIDEENIIYSFAGPMMSKDGFAEWLATLPWNQEKEVTMLPIYKNLAYVSKAGETVYLDEETLTTMADDIAVKLNMDVTSRSFHTIDVGEQAYVCEIEVRTDLGAIRISGRGEVFVSYNNGVKLMNGSVMSDKATTQEANETVAFLAQQYAHLFSETEWIPISYEEYDSINGVDFTRKMNYHMASGSVAHPLVEYYFKQVGFDYVEELGMTRIHYGDVRMAAESLGYYSVVSYEEAKELLLQGQYIPYHLSYRDVDGVEKRTFSDSDEIKAVVLMYDTSATEEYYQPYYCFYVELSEQPNSYYKYYVPAIRGVGLDGLPPQTESTVIDLTAYEMIDDLLYVDDMGQYYTIENGKIVEIDYSWEDESEIDHSAEIISEVTENGVELFLRYDGGSENLNLTQLMKDIRYEALDARCIQGKVLIFCYEYTEGLRIVTCYVYSKEEQSLTPTVFSEREYVFDDDNLVHGILFNGGRYATIGEKGEKLKIIDVLDGSTTDTDVPSDVISDIWEASKEHYAFVYKTGKIDIIEKETGKLVKRTEEKISFTPDNIIYKDGILYVVPADARYLLYVINEFES